jgi:hypothetical protein
MGQAKNRGTKEQRIAAAVAAGRHAGAPERTKPYANRMPLTTPMLNYLWGQFKVVGDRTINEIRSEALLAQKAAQARRFAESQQASAQNLVDEKTFKTNARVIEEMIKGPAQAELLQLDSGIDQGAKDLMDMLHG